MASQNHLPNSQPPQTLQIACGGCLISAELHAQADRRAGLVIIVERNGFDDLPRFSYEFFSEAGYSVLSVALLEDAESVRSSQEYTASLLAHRLSLVIEWVSTQRSLRRLPIGLFGVGHGATAALQVAAEYPLKIACVVAHSAHPEISEDYLKNIFAPTLFVNGMHDADFELKTELCFETLRCVKHEIALSELSAMTIKKNPALDWFLKHLPCLSPTKIANTTRPPKISPEVSL